MNEELWAVHYEGPDEVIPAESEFEARRLASEFNTAWDRDPQNSHPYQPKVEAFAVPWTGTPEEHHRLLLSQELPWTSMRDRVDERATVIKTEEPGHGSDLNTSDYPG